MEILGSDGQLLFVDLESVESYIVFDQTIEKDTFFQDSASNRLIIIPTGFPMEPGEFHVADQEIAAVTMSYGLNEHVSFWSGISIPGLLLNVRYIASFTQNLAVSFGSFAGFSWVETDGDSLPGVVIPYTIGSWGDPNNNVTIGGGPLIYVDFKSDPVMDLSGAACVIGGKKVLTSTTSLIFENWIVWGPRNDYNPLSLVPVSISEDLSSDKYDEFWSSVPSMLFPAVCFRIAGERLSWDIGVVVPLMISNEEEITVEADEEDDSTHFWQNTAFKLMGPFDEVIIPIPILSITYRID